MTKCKFFNMILVNNEMMFFYEMIFFYEMMFSKI